MPQSEPIPLLRYLRKLAGAPGTAELTDAVLLERFVAARDEAAFELLLWRHGAMVLGVCRGVLRGSHDVEDAFQATFMALARKAGSISRRASLAGWLYQVAYRVALKARAHLKLRVPHEPADLDAIARTTPGPGEEAAWRELRPFLHEEVSRLPAKYRVPIVLCYLEGKTNEEAAHELGWTKGTVSGRLARARDLLRRRLTRRGVLLPAGLLTAAVLPDAASEAVSAELIRTSARAAVAFAAEKVVAAQPAALAKGVLRAMAMTRLKLATVLILALGAAGLTAGFLAHPGRAAPVAVAQDEKTAAPATPAPRRERRGTDVASPRDGILVMIGTELKEGEHVPADQVVTVGTRKYRRLHEGDAVEAHQLVARLDDRLAREEVTICEQKLQIAKSEFDTAQKTADEARFRYERIKKLEEAKAVSPEEVAERRLAWEKYANEVKAKQAAIGLTEAELRHAKTVLDMHEIRSPIRGVIRIIYKDPGEGVKALEPVLQIGPEAKPRPGARARPAEHRIDVAAPREGILVSLTGREGDRVAAGQVLARVDDRLARNELEIKGEKLKAAQADLRTAEKTRDEAKVRYERMMQLVTRGLDVARDELDGCRLTLERFTNEVEVRKANVRITELEVRQAQTVVELHEVRSPAAGFIRIVYRKPGEAIKALEPVVQIETVRD